MNSNLLSASESSYDELGRDYQDSRVLFVNTIPTLRPADVAEGASDIGLGSLTPGQTQAIPGVAGVTILGRVSDRTEYDRDSRVTFAVADDPATTRSSTTVPAASSRRSIPRGTRRDGLRRRQQRRSRPARPTSRRSGVAPEVFLTTNFYDSLDRLDETVDNLGETSTTVRLSQRPGGQGRCRRTARPGDRPPRLPGRSPHRRHHEPVRQRHTVFLRRTRPSDDARADPDRLGSGDGAHIGASIFGVKDDPAAPESFPPAADRRRAAATGSSAPARSGTRTRCNPR